MRKKRLLATGSVEINGILKSIVVLQKKNVVLQKNKKIVKEPISDEVKEVLKNSKLTDKQRLFCSYYVKYRNKTKAYMKAYNCSWENANANAYRLWENVGVRKLYEEMPLREINF